MSSDAFFPDASQTLISRCTLCHRIVEIDTLLAHLKVRSFIEKDLAITHTKPIARQSSFHTFFIASSKISYSIMRRIRTSHGLHPGVRDRFSILIL